MIRDGAHQPIAWISQAALAQPYIQSIEFQNQWNAPSWSIGCEAFFYLVLPFFLLGIARLKNGWFLLALAIVFFGVDCAINLGMENTPVLVRHPFVRVWEFLIGCVFGVLFLRHQRIKMSTGLLLALLVVDLAWFVVDPSKLALVFTICVPIFVCLIYSLASGKTVIHRLLGWRPAVVLGDASYSLYLIHWLPMLLVTHWFGASGRVPVSVSLACIVGSIVASIISYCYYERPMRDWLNNNIGRAKVVQSPVMLSANHA